MTAPDPFPRRAVEPLPPPAGSFDAVVGRARARRYRRVSTITGVTGVFLVGLLGGLALGGGVTGVQQTIIQMANRASAAATQAAATATHTSAAGIPATGHKATGHKPSKRPTTSSPTTAAPPTTPASSTAPAVAANALAVRGRVVDSRNRPIGGLYVYTGSMVAGRFVPGSAPAAVTGRHGGYAVECGGPVLLTSWPLNTPLPPAAGGRWAATFVDKPLCGLPGRVTPTTVQPGGTLRGQVSTDLGCPDAGFGLSVQLWGDQATTVRVRHLHEGDRYQVSGLPADAHVVVAQGVRSPVTVAAGRTTPDDVTFSCPAQPSPSPSPTDTPQPTPTETDTASPTATPTPTGVPTSTAPATPTGSVSGP